MSMITVNTDPSRTELRQFGFVWLGFFVVFGVVAWLKFDNRSIAQGLWIAAVVIPFIGWFVPAFMRVVFVGMSFAAFPIGFVVSHVVLAVVYFLVLTPIGLVMKLLGHDPMTREFDRDSSTYWVDRQPHPSSKQYFRQY